MLYLADFPYCKMYQLASRRYCNFAHVVGNIVMLSLLQYNNLLKRDVPQDEEDLGLDFLSNSLEVSSHAEEANITSP